MKNIKRFLGVAVLTLIAFGTFNLGASGSNDFTTLDFGETNPPEYVNGITYMDFGETNPPEYVNG